VGTIPALALALTWGLVPSVAGAQEAGLTRDQLDDYLGRLVTEVRADVADMERFEPFLVLHVLHDERGYRVRASDLLERRLADALAAQRIRVIDQTARRRILDDLEECYTDEAPFCSASDVVGRFRTAGGVFEGSVLPVRGGTELRLKLVVAAGAAGLSPGEIVGTWSATVPPPALDPVQDLLPAAGVVSYGRPPGDSLAPEQLGELRVDVRTRDGTPAWVQIDGRVVVPAPVTTTTTAGQHLLTVTAGGHRPFSDYVEVPPRGMVRREIFLERGVGSIRVTANTRQATVFLDARPVGTTPWQGRDIETGPHSVRVEKEGFLAFSTELVLEHEENEQVDVELAELPGDVVVTCLHDDITVFLDESARGPVGRCSTGESLTLSNIEPGLHRIWGARGPDRTAAMNVTVRGGQAVPVSLALWLDASPEEREAIARSGGREYEPFGGYRLTKGLYVDIGVTAGRAEWEMAISAYSEEISVTGVGPRLVASVFVGTWELSFGGDFVFLENFEGFNNARFYELHLGLTGYLLPQSSVRPFIGVRGLYSRLSFEDPISFGDPQLTAGSLGAGAHAGINIQLGRSSALQVGASYSWSADRDIRGTVEFGGRRDKVGELNGWRYASGFAALWINVH
jgi:hypothetical protein